MVPRKSAEDRKAELVQVTLQLADTLGPDRLTTAVVARAVGVTQPAVFRHFPTKSALWLAVAEHVARTMAQAWETALADAATPLVRIDRLVMAQLGLIEQYPALPAILFSRELSTENADLRDRLPQSARPVPGAAGRRTGPWRRGRCGARGPATG